MNPFSASPNESSDPFASTIASTGRPSVNHDVQSNHQEQHLEQQEPFVVDSTTPQKILWSCISRNDVILAEAGEDCYGGAVIETARGLLKRQATPGYEFHSAKTKWQFRKKQQNSNQHVPSLRGCKFHIFEHDSEQMDKARVWVFATVYDSNLISQSQVQSFMEKIVVLTQMYRDDETNLEWRTGGTLACQSTFAPILLQRMQEVTYLGRMALLEERLEDTKQIMGNNIDVILEREDMLRDKLSQKSTAMNEMATVFRKRSRRVRRMKLMQNAKHGIVLGSAVTAGVAIVVVPPLVAIL